MRWCPEIGSHDWILQRSEKQQSTDKAEAVENHCPHKPNPLMQLNKYWPQLNVTYTLNEIGLTNYSVSKKIKIFQLNINH